MQAPDRQQLDTLTHYTGLAVVAQQLVREVFKPRQIKPEPHVFTLRPSVLPRPENVVDVTLEGAKHTVGLEKDEDGEWWVDSILMGGKWHSACDTFAPDFVKALERELREDFAYEAAASAEGPL